jgi:hypothetical protein
MSGRYFSTSYYNQLELLCKLMRAHSRDSFTPLLLLLELFSLDIIMSMLLITAYFSSKLTLLSPFAALTNEENSRQLSNF